MAAAEYQEFWYHMVDADGEPDQVAYEWKRRTDGPPWEVIDWRGKTHTFATESEGIDFIERDKRMLGNASRAAMQDANVQINKAFQHGSGVESDHGESSEDREGQDRKAGAGTRRTRHRRPGGRAGRAANGTKAARRGR